MRAGSHFWGHYHVVPTTTRPVLNAQGDNTAVTALRLFRWGALVSASCTAQTTLCWTQTTTITISSGVHSGQLVDNDSGRADGVGACFRVEAGTWKDSIPFRRLFDQAGAIGGREGYCSGNTTTVNWPCDAAGDCGSGGTCNTTSNNAASVKEKIAGAFLVSRAAVATDCFISEEY
jgi:hypothetical protein